MAALITVFMLITRRTLQTFPAYGKVERRIVRAVCPTRRCRHRAVCCVRVNLKRRETDIDSRAVISVTNGLSARGKRFYLVTLWVAVSVLACSFESIVVG